MGPRPPSSQRGQDLPPGAPFGPLCPQPRAPRGAAVFSGFSSAPRRALQLLTRPHGQNLPRHTAKGGSTRQRGTPEPGGDSDQPAPFIISPTEQTRPRQPLERLLVTPAGTRHSSGHRGKALGTGSTAGAEIYLRDPAMLPRASRARPAPESPPRGPHHSRPPGVGASRPGLGPSRPHSPRVGGLNSAPSRPAPLLSATASTCSPVQTHGAAARPASARPCPPSGAERRANPERLLARSGAPSLPPAQRSGGA